MARHFSPYELNQLYAHGIDPTSVADSEMPVEYITGHVQFGELDLVVSPDVLIPRVETEELVELAIEHLSDLVTQMPNMPIGVIEVGTGSGAITAALAHTAHQRSWPISFIASDLSPRAVKLAKKNIFAHIPEHGLKPTVVVSHLLKHVPATIAPALIIANLPYIPTARIGTLDESVRQFEPHLALDGGEDGLVIIRHLLKQVEQRFGARPPIVLLEIDHTHTLPQLLAGLSLHWQGQIFPDQFGQPRFAKLWVDQSPKKDL